MRTTSKFPTMVLESLVDTTRFNVSLEEELLITDNANADADTVRRTLDQAERTLETSDALSDLADTASRITEATPGEVELIDRVTQTAVAGTEVDSERIAPAMEQYIGKAIATESIAETARKMLDVVLAFAKKIYERIKGFYNQSVVIPAQIKRIDELLGRIRQNKDGAINKATAGENTATSLQVGGVVDLSPAGLMKNLSMLSDAFSYAAEPYAAALEARAGEIESAINAFKPESAAAVTDGLVKALSGIAFPGIPGGSTEVKSKDGSYFASTGPNLLGNIALSARRFDTTGGDAVESLERIRKSMVAVNTDADSGGAAPGDSAYTAEQMIATLEACKALLKKLQDYPKSQKHIALEKAAGRIQQASTALAGRMKEVQSETPSAEDGASVEDQYKALVSFNIGLGTWMEQPAMPLYRSSLQAVRAIVHTFGQMVGGNAEAKA